jgi:23S rRNA pseudouridine1911/1915/1917 synthase
MTVSAAPSPLVLWYDEHLLAVSKPAGVPVQSGPENTPPLTDLLQNDWPELHLTHRLDTPTSGIVLLGRTAAAAAALNQTFASGQVRKTYLAILPKALEPASGTLVHYLRRNGQTMKSTIRNTPTKDFKQAITRYEMLAQSSQYHLAALYPETGRFHQLRAQMGFLQCAIKGDVKYGARRGNPDRSIGLHAWQVAFTHPVSGAAMQITAPLPVQDALWQFFDTQLHPQP